MIKYDVEGLEHKKKEIQNLKDSMEELRQEIKNLWDNLETENTPNFLNKIEKLLVDDLENFGVRTENGVSSLNDKLHNIKEAVIETDNNLIK